MIKLTANPEINYGENQLTVIGAFEQDGRTYDIVVETDGDLLKKGGQLPDLAGRIQRAWQAAYGEVLAAPGQKKLAPEKVTFTYRPDEKIARVVASELSRFAGLKTKAISDTMQNLYRDIGARVIATRLHESPAPAATPSRGMQALQAQIAPLFAKHASKEGHLFFGYKLENVKKCPKAQKAIQQAVLNKEPNDHRKQIKEFIAEIQQLFQAVPDAQEVHCKELAQEVFRELFTSEETQDLFEAESKRLDTVD